MNSRDFLKNSAICASRAGERHGVGNLPLRSASSMKARADSPVGTGDELIVIAISGSVWNTKLQYYNELNRYTLLKILEEIYSISEFRDVRG